jgi:hypothetical protein
LNLDCICKRNGKSCRPPGDAHKKTSEITRNISDSDWKRNKASEKYQNRWIYGTW